jgi:hypothetical protein
MRGVLAALLLCACGESSMSIDAPAIDAPAHDAPAIDAPAIDAPTHDAQPSGILVSKWPRGSETFVPISGGSAPIVEGIQGFRYFETQWRVPASVNNDNPSLVLHYDISGLGGMDQMSTIGLMPASGVTRDSDRYLIFFNQYTIDQLDGAVCHITAQFPLFTQLGTWDVTVTLRRSGCLDSGVDVVCPDGGVP